MLDSSLVSYLDEVDRQILVLLQEDGRLSNAEIARRVNLSPPATHARVRRLETEGYIKQYAAILDREHMGFDMLCFVSVSLQLHQFEAIERFKEIVQSMPEVLACFHITGEFDYLLQVVIRNRKDLEQFVVRKLTPIPGMARISTSLVLTEIKSTMALPLA